MSSFYKFEYGGFEATTGGQEPSLGYHNQFMNLEEEEKNAIRFGNKPGQPERSEIHYTSETQDDAAAWEGAPRNSARRNSPRAQLGASRCHAAQ